MRISKRWSSWSPEHVNNRCKHWSSEENKRHETCVSEDCFKIAKFWIKTTSHGHRSGDVDDVQRRCRFAQKGHKWWRIKCMTLKPKHNHPNGSVQKSQDRKRHVEFGQMWIYFEKIENNGYFVITPRMCCLLATWI